MALKSARDTLSMTVTIVTPFHALSYHPGLLGEELGVDWM